MAMDGHFRLCRAWMPFTADPDFAENYPLLFSKPHPNKLQKDRPGTSESKAGTGLCTIQP